jgi:hypothetical protein
MRGSFVWAVQLAALFISNQARDVAFWHLADVPLAMRNVRFRGKSGHDADQSECPLMTQSGH